MFLTGQPFPAPLQIGVLDQATAITLSHAIITALLARERQGHGQAVQVSLFGAALWLYGDVESALAAFREDKYYYSFNHGPVHIIVLDTGEDKADSHPVYAGLADFDKYRDSQAEWLKSNESGN